MIINPAELSRKDRYKLLTGTVIPRPIAWVSSMDGAGNLNLAPFSYFNAVSASPMVLMFSAGIHSDGRRKDTWANVDQVGEFVVNLTNEETAEAMNRSATVLPAGMSEFPWAGVTPAPSETISVPRVAEAPVSFECKLRQIVIISEEPGGGAAIFGDVQRIHIREEIYQGGYVLLEPFKPIGRLAGPRYTRVNNVFEMFRLPPPEDV